MFVSTVVLVADHTLMHAESQSSELCFSISFCKQPKLSKNSIANNIHPCVTPDFTAKVGQSLHATFGITYVAAKSSSITYLEYHR